MFFLRIIIPFFGCKYFGFVASYIYIDIPFFSEDINKLIYMFCFFCFIIIIMIEKLYESPLSPFIIIGITGTYFPIPIKRKT